MGEGGRRGGEGKEAMRQEVDVGGEGRETKKRCKWKTVK